MILREVEKNHDLDDLVVNQHVEPTPSEKYTTVKLDSISPQIFWVKIQKQICETVKLTCQRNIDSQSCFRVVQFSAPQLIESTVFSGF